jgi:alkyl sulfatase BDS1-like metallo-beta-lactamase superfamily hydrolase
MPAQDPAPSVHPELAAHQAAMEKRIYSIGKRYHLAFAYSTSNCTMIEGDDGVILVDTLNSMDAAEEAAAAFRAITDKPIKAIIYTHFHADHVSGAKAFVNEDDVAAGRVKIYGHEDLTGHILRDVGLIAPVLGRRALYQFGMRLPIGEDGTVGAGLGPPQRPGTRTFMAPTDTFSGKLVLDIAGVHLEIHHVPSETEDQCMVWVPDDKVLLSGDAVQGETFPNIYALRGTRFRDPLVWADGMETLRKFKPETLIPHHGRPVEGAAAVDDVLINYRDAIQYLHDQTLRWMNKGMTPDEIKDRVVMPDHLKSHPWLGEYYGSYKHGIPAVYAGYLGWFDGDPVNLDPLPWAERAQRYVAMMGGRDNILETAEAALADGDSRWAADLATWLVRADLDDTVARSLKARALRHWGFRQNNTTWRNWALTSAMELEGTLDMAAAGMVLGSPEQVAGYPLAAVMRIMTVRLMAEHTFDYHRTLGFQAVDSGEACALEIRRGVCRFHDTVPSGADAVLKFDRPVLTEWMFGRISVEDALNDHRMRLEGGDGAMVSEFLSKFEPFNQADPIAISAR